MSYFIQNVTTPIFYMHQGARQQLQASQKQQNQSKVLWVVRGYSVIVNILSYGYLLPIKMALNVCLACMRLLRKDVEKNNAMSASLAKIHQTPGYTAQLFACMEYLGNKKMYILMWLSYILYCNRDTEIMHKFYINYNTVLTGIMSILGM